MGDNAPTVSTEVATGREPVATDEIDGQHHQKVKLEFGGDDVATQVSTLDPLPIEEQSPLDLSGLATQTTLAAVLTELGQKLEAGGEVALSAATLAALETITVANPTADPETGLATQTTLAAVLAKLIAAPATEAKQDAIRDRLPSSLDNGSLDVADAYTAGQALASQAGAGAVLTFSFSAARDLIWVRSVGDISYADPFGGTPADGTGVYIADDEPTPLTVRASAVKVWAPSGATVFVWGYGA